MGTLRIHFTADDLARVTLADAHDPLWEMILTRFRFRDRVRPLAFRPWFEELHAEPARTAQMRQGARLLDSLVPSGPYFPDFLTPHEGLLSIERGLAALLGTPRGRLAAELWRLARHHSLPGWVRPLAEGDLGALKGLVAALRDYHEAAVAPFHELMTAAVAVDRACRAHSMLSGGVDGLFAGMRPLFRWTPPVLQTDYIVDKDLVLGGRGLLLVPSYFCHRAPLTLADPELPPVLIYPIEQRHRWRQPVTHRRDLGALMGANRSAVLHALDRSATTTQLARMLRISPAAASRHATVLREAGLIETRRDGIAVLHTLTPLGAALLDGSTGHLSA
ncbi:ArsR/SmtB family transcription factor [Nonomuraea cavernae]|uniref:Transcriptional regulator n=1 Tax=Nonomuraea cavernae TaxID=2045107 RepID=A0A918DRM1_9ACTN|nr:winged helix-turn-helix domain-containing protein [Nonomuraea cavernae]MCA2190371.1 winged helix-turn-helix domain-containing protein [Nonomuraea cavernae]GGO80786.1 transcriptional regulator [Nonomuraea cavernae]